MTIDEVPLWLVHRGVGHAVACVRDGYTSLACDQWGNFIRSTTQSERPKRICWACRERLKDATLTEREG